MGHRTQENIYLPDYWFIIKGFNRNSQMEEIHRGRCVGMGEELLCPLQEHHNPSTSTCSPPQQLSEPCHFQFYGGIITWAWFIISLATGDWKSPASLSSLGSGSKAGSYTLQSWLVSLTTNLYPEGLSKSHLISINS